MSKLKKRLIFTGAALLIIVLLEIWGYWLKIENYTVHSEKVTEPVRIVFISDLHNCTYGGSDQSEIWEAIQSAEPDMVLFGGDVIDMYGGYDNALTLMELVKESYPCAYAAGNHEQMRSDRKEFWEKASALGIPPLTGTYTETDIKGSKVRVYGIEDTLEYGINGTQLENCYDTLDTGCINILLNHKPEQMEDITALAAEYGRSFDIVLSGHAHGGQWRLPVILEQGLYAPDQGLFPERTNGMYSYGAATLIISRGLARPMRMIFIPRIFNRPELSVIEIQPE